MNNEMAQMEEEEPDVILIEHNQSIHNEDIEVRVENNEQVVGMGDKEEEDGMSFGSGPREKDEAIGL